MRYTYDPGKRAANLKKHGFDFKDARRVIESDRTVTFEGPGLDGEVLPGADWQLARRDGVLEIDARYALRERSGGIVRVLSQGYRHGPPEVLAALARGEAVDPAAYFFRTVMRFETGHERLAWLNRVIAIASGARRARQVLLSAHSLL